MREDYEGASKALSQEDVIDFSKMESDLNATASKYLSSSIGKVFSRGNLSVESMGGLKRIQYSGLKDKNRTSIRMKTMQNFLPQISKCIGVLKKEYIRGLTKGMDQSALNSLNKTILQLISIHKILNQTIKEMQATGEYLKPFRDENNEYNILGKSLSMLDYLTKAYSSPTQEEIGTVAEYFGAAGAMVAGGQASKITADLLSNLVVGGKSSGSNTTLQVSAFVDGKAVLDALNKNVVGGENAKWTLSPDGKTLVSSHITQDTVDIDITFNDSNNIFGTDHLRASIKNYFDPANANTKHPGVNVISGVPFTSILNLVGSNFSNHYLNYLVGNGSSGGDFAYAENVLKYILAVRGLSGARSSTFNKLSQYFMVFSRKDKRAYVFTTNDLLEKISPAPGVFNGQYATVTGMPTAGSLRGANARVDSANTLNANVQQRIANVIAGAHAFKLSMSLTPNIFG